MGCLPAACPPRHTNTEHSNSRFARRRGRHTQRRMQRQLDDDATSRGGRRVLRGADAVTATLSGCGRGRASTHCGLCRYGKSVRMPAATHYGLHCCGKSVRILRGCRGAGEGAGVHGCVPDQLTATTIVSTVSVSSSSGLWGKIICCNCVNGLNRDNSQVV